MGLQADRGFGRVDSDGEVVQRHLHHTAPHPVGVLRIVGEGLRIGQQQELLMRVLKPQAVAQRSGIVAKVQRAGGAVAGENNGSGHGSVLV